MHERNGTVERRNPSSNRRWVNAVVARMLATSIQAGNNAPPSSAKLHRSSRAWTRGDDVGAPSELCEREGKRLVLLHQRGRRERDMIQ